MNSVSISSPTKFLITQMTDETDKQIANEQIIEGEKTIIMVMASCMYVYQILSS